MKKIILFILLFSTGYCYGATPTMTVTPTPTLTHTKTPVFSPTKTPVCSRTITPTITPTTVPAYLMIYYKEKLSGISKGIVIYQGSDIYQNKEVTDKKVIEYINLYKPTPIPASQLTPVIKPTAVKTKVIVESVK